jgi:predicted P-loop ATPase
MKDQAMNAMKRAITLNYTNVRGAYQRHAERRPHIASFCGTGNNEKFLNDPTGTRRWLAFKVESLLSPLDIPFEYEGLYAQAYHLYKEGFQYWFDNSEAADQRNSRFMVPNLERQLVNRYFLKPNENAPCEFVDVAIALQKFPVNVTSKIRKEAVDQAFIDLGFEPVTIDGNPGYFAIVRKDDEVRMMGLQMAYNARRAMNSETS